MSRAVIFEIQAADETDTRACDDRSDARRQRRQSKCRREIAGSASDAWLQ